MGNISGIQDARGRAERAGAEICGTQRGSSPPRYEPRPEDRAEQAMERATGVQRGGGGASLTPPASRRAGGSPPLPTSPHPSSLPGASADGITTPHESHTCRLHVAAHVPALTPPTPYRSRHRWLRFKPLVVGPADQAGPAHAAGTISKLYVYLLGTMD